MPTIDEKVIVNAGGTRTVTTSFELGPRARIDVRGDSGGGRVHMPLVD